MFFVWTNDGGPLQYIGLGLFLLQMMVPSLLQQLQLTPSLPVFQAPSNTTATTTNNNNNTSSSPFPSSIAVGLVAGIVAMIVYKYWQREQTQEHHPAQPQRQPQQAEQGADDPTNANANNNNNNDANINDNTDDANTRTRIMRSNIVQWRTQLQVKLNQWTGLEWTNVGVSCLVGVAAGSLATGYMAVSPGTLYHNILPYLYQFVTLASIIMTVIRQRGNNNSNGNGGTEQQRRRLERRRHTKMAEMTTLVQRVPTEPFVTNEALANAQDVSIVQLKKMLLTRGTTHQQLDSFVDRQNLVEALRDCRRYSDTCCICFEAYEQGETKLRVLPKCRHELHVECLDKWVYTFATNPVKLRLDPTCPLCKETLK